METEKATGPAWQVRESARQNFLNHLEQKIIGKEDDFAKHNLFNLYWTLSYLFYSELRYSDQGLGYNDFSREGWANERGASSLFSEVLEEINKFQHSKEEKHVILAALLEWAVSEITRPYHSALQTKNLDLLKTLYGVESSMDKVPLE